MFFCVLNHLQPERFDPDMLRNGYYKLGYSYFYNDTDRALACYKSALRYIRHGSKYHYLDINVDSLLKHPSQVLCNEGIDNAPCYYIAYNLACLYTRKKEYEKAWSWFELSLKMGYPHYDFLYIDSDIADLRNKNNSEFNFLIELYK